MARAGAKALGRFGAPVGVSLLLCSCGDDSTRCTPVALPSFAVETCRAAAQSTELVLEGACEGADVRCTSGDPCASCAVTASAAGPCSVTVQLGAETFEGTVTLVPSAECSPAYTVRRGEVEVVALGPDCE